jgi:ribosomal-protein-alanine N-acetyltransferase
MPPIEPIFTQRLRIREFEAGDREPLLSFVRDPSQIEHMLLFLETEAKLDAFFSFLRTSATAEPRQQWHFAIDDQATQRYLGSCCLMVEHEAPSSAEIGYWFVREAWGKGYASEAAAAMLALGFARLGFHRIWGKCHVDNTQSARVMEKLGMRYEGTLREHVWLRDHYRSSRIYGMLASEYCADGYENTRSRLPSGSSAVKV